MCDGSLTKRQADAVVPVALRGLAAAAYLGISRRQLDRLRKTDPTFPRPYILGTHIIAWSRKQLEEWLEQQPTADN